MSSFLFLNVFLKSWAFQNQHPNSIILTAFKTYLIKIYTSIFQNNIYFFFLDYQPICFYVDGDNVGEIEEDAFAFPKMTDQQIAANLAESGIVDQPAAATVSSTPEVKK